MENRKKYLLKYEDAEKIVEKYNNQKFFKKETIIDGYKVCTFNYFLCEYNDFMYPLGKDSKVTAFDMRGTTFVFNKKGRLYKTFYMLPKFFNINQVEETLYDKVKNKKIRNIGIKEDGSLIGFFELPNKKIYAKTINGFDNEMSLESNKILLKHPKWKQWIKLLLNMNFTPLFEYVSYDNRIVLKYNKKELRYIGVRDNFDGKFYPSLMPIEEEAEAFDIVQNPPKDMPLIWSIRARLNDFIELAKTEENKEGWVILFEDGQLMKIKTEWYFNIHGLRTENIFREDYVIKNYLDETLDDIITQLDREEDKDAFEFIDRVINAVENYLKKVYTIVEIYDKVFYNKYFGKIHTFAKNYNKEPFFWAWTMYNKLRDNNEKDEKFKTFLIKHIKFKTQKLKRAKQFVNENYFVKTEEDGNTSKD